MATFTPNFGLAKPVVDGDDDVWGYLLNGNADTLDTALFKAGTLGTDIANIKHYDGGPTNDDALRFRNAIASGIKTIFVPPGTYTFKSRVVQPGPFFPDPPPCVLFNTVDDVTVIADGATFLIDDALAAAPPLPPYDTAGTAHVGFMGDCHNMRWRGGRFVGNTTGMGSRVNAGMWFYCVTGITIEETEWLGEWRNGPFNGVWMFDCTFRNNRTYGGGLCFDLGYVENLLLIGNRCEGGAGYASNLGSTGFKLFADPATHFFNTAGQTYKQVTWLSTGAVRQLRTDKISNNVRLIGNTFNKWNTAIYLDGVNGASVCENTIRDGPFVTAPSASGITIATSAQTVAFGAITRGIYIHDNDIYANGGPGVQLAPDATAGVGTVEIVNNRIYDNQCPAAVAFVFNNVFVGTFRLIDNDFNTRTASSVQVTPYNAATMTAIGAIVRGNLGVTPYDQAGAFSTITTTGDVTIANARALRLSDTVGAVPRLLVQADNNMVLFGSDASGVDRPLLASQQRSSTSPLAFYTSLTTNSGPFNVINGRLLSSTVGGNPTVAVSDGTTSGGMFISGAALNIGATNTSAAPTAAWVTLTSNLTKIGGRVITTFGGQAASYVLSDATNYAGMFMNGTGVAWGPTSNVGVPSAIWASIDGTALVAAVPVRHNSTVGFNNTAPIAKPTVSGAKGSNTALASLLAALVSYGLVTDSTTA